MGRPPTGNLSPAQLRKAYVQDLSAAWTRARHAHAKETPYAFVLYGTEGGEPPQLVPCVLTEESLTRVAQRYLDKGYHDTLNEARAALRYSVADSPHASELQDAVPTVDALTRPHARRLDDDSGYALLAKAAIAALQELDAGGLFGKGAERNRLLLIIVTEDTPKDWSTESARKCNPAAVFARFEADTKVEGVYSASDTIAIAPDGNSLYSAGSRDKPDAAKDDDCSEMVAYDLRDARLTRRWTVEDPGLGRSICRLAVAPDGHSVVAAGAKYADKISHCELWRFAANSGKVTHQRQFVGDFADLGQSAEGQRLAVTCHNKTLHLFDADFKPLARRAFEQKVRSPLFLRSGQLLLATDKGILSLDPAGDVEPTIVTPLRAFHLVADGGQTLLAVAQRTHRPSASEISYGRAPGTEFGVHLLRLPDFNPIRTILLPNHQVNRPTLSPDGRLLAFEAQEIGKPRSFLAIFDTITGAEIARREIDAMHQLAFLPDNQTLAIAVSKISTTEPIDFWRISK